MEIREISVETEEYRDFLKRYDHWLFHTFHFKKFIETAFGCVYRFIAAVEGDAVKTVLPIVEVKSRLFGNKVISTAYIEYGGFAGDEDFVKDILKYLQMNYKKNNQYLEIRGRAAFDEILSKKLQKADLYKRFVLKLGGVEDVWNGIQKSKRKAIKKSLKGVEVKELSASDVGDFYQLYLRNMRRFGSPPYSKNYFETFFEGIVEHNLGRIYGAYCNGTLAAALLGFHYGDRVHILIAVSDPTYQEHRPNDAVHWKFIEWACESGYTWFDFGRVREESGQFEYKRKWGGELLELPSYFALWNTKKIPIVDPKKHGMLTEAWKKMPLWLTRLIGMKLRKGLGI